MVVEKPIKVIFGLRPYVMFISVFPVHSSAQFVLRCPVLCSGAVSSGNQRNEDENKIGCYVSEIANYLNAFRPLPEGDGFRNDSNGRNANKLNAQFFKPPGVFSVKAGSDFR